MTKWVGDASLSLGTTRWGTFLNSLRENEKVSIKTYLFGCPTAV